MTVNPTAARATPLHSLALRAANASVKCLAQQSTTLLTTLIGAPAHFSRTSSTRPRVSARRFELPTEKQVGVPILRARSGSSPFRHRFPFPIDRAGLIGVSRHLFLGNFRQRLDDCLAFNGATIARSSNEIPLYFATAKDVAATPIAAITDFLSLYQLGSGARIPVCKISRGKWLAVEIGEHPLVIVPNKGPKLLYHDRTICGSDRSLVSPCVAPSAASSNFGSNFVGHMNDR